MSHPSPAPLDNINVYDFDQTVSKKHTFGRHKLTPKKNNQSCKVRAFAGFNAANNNMKGGIKQHINQTGPVVIATYHNNPDFIVGFLCRVLNHLDPTSIDLVLQEKSKKPTTAINIYRIAGFEHPVIISYIPEMGETFTQRISDVEGKNKQLCHLRDVLSCEGVITKDALMNFYDDTEDNARNVDKLSNVQGWLVDKHSSDFYATCVVACERTPRSNQGSTPFWQQVEPSVTESAASLDSTSRETSHKP